MEHNGGEPYPNAILIESNNLEIDVQLFYAIKDKMNPTITIGYNLTIHEDRSPHGIIPIATDSGGNIIFLDTNPGLSGRIYYWDTEQEHEESKKHSMENFFQVSDSFSQFLNSLYEIEE